MSIPKHIIQTDSTILKSEKCIKTWCEMNADFEHYFFNDSDGDAFVKKEYPQFYKNYSKLPKAAQKADFFRYLAIYRFGGIYADTDTICLAPLSTYLDFSESSLILGVDLTTAIYTNTTEKLLDEYFTPVQYAQFVFAASPNHGFLKLLINHIDTLISKYTQEELIRLSKDDRFVLSLTGPFVFSSIFILYTSLTEYKDWTILPQTIWGYTKWHNNEPSTMQDVKVHHLCASSWRTYD